MSNRQVIHPQGVKKYEQEYIVKNTVSIISAALILLVSSQGDAAKVKVVQWNFGGTGFQGNYYKGLNGKAGIVIFHQWMGLSNHEKDVAERLNKLGYTVLAADVYGKGKIPADRAQAKKTATSFYSSRLKLRNHANAAFQKLVSLSGIKENKIFAIGYCFGGSTVLELGRSGTETAGIVSLHGGLANPNPGDDAKIKGKILILHGAEDKAVSMKDVNASIQNLRKYKKDWSLHIFSDAVHGFTHRHDRKRYNKKADNRSWEIMLNFFREK